MKSAWERRRTSGRTGKVTPLRPGEGPGVRLPYNVPSSPDHGGLTSPCSVPRKPFQIPPETWRHGPQSEEGRAGVHAQLGYVVLDGSPAPSGIDSWSDDDASIIRPQIFDTYPA